MNNIDTKIKRKKIQHLIPFSVDLVGAGGTGSWFINCMNFEFKNIIPIFYDFDYFEPKNLSRQNFSKHQVYNNKAKVISYNLMENKEIPSLYEPIDYKYAEIASPIVIGFVDTIDARHSILEVMAKDNNPKLLIDTGNEDSYGQIIVTYYDGKLFHTRSEFIEILKKNSMQVRTGSCVNFIEQTASINKANAILANLVFSRIISFILDYNSNVVFTKNNRTFNNKYKEFDLYTHTYKYNQYLDQNNLNKRFEFRIPYKYNKNSFEYAFKNNPKLYINGMTPVSVLETENEIVTISIDEIREINKIRLAENLANN